MPCLLGCLALMVPRVVLVGVFLFTNYLELAFRTKLWPLLGFIFMPLTTLAYAFAKNSSPNHMIDGWYLGLIIVAAMIDVGLLGGGGWKGRAYRWRRSELHEDWRQRRGGDAPE